MFFVKSCQSSEWLFLAARPLTCSQSNSSFSSFLVYSSLIVLVPRLHMSSVRLYVFEHCLFRLLVIVVVVDVALLAVVVVVLVLVH